MAELEDQAIRRSTQKPNIDTGDVIELQVNNGVGEHVIQVRLLP